MTASEPDRTVFTVAEINRAVQQALRDSFPAPVWVRGEVQRLPADAARRKHLYFELHDAAGGDAASFQIPAALMEWDRKRFGLGAFLDGSDPQFQLRNKLEVCLQCQIDFYPPFGKLSLKVVGIDPEFTLGQLEARRREVLAWLKKNDLLDRNARLMMAELPLRIGLITSRGSAAEQDFRTGLEASPWAFDISPVDCRMQGQNTAPHVVAALGKLARAGVDVIVITRGGGSRADLSWFDQQELVAAVAECPLPVITAIGHEIDTSIADAVAHTSCKTPTAAAEFLVGRIDEAAARLDAAAERLQRAALAVLDPRRLRELTTRLESRVTRHVSTARAQLDRRHGRLLSTSMTALASAKMRCDDQARRLAPGRLLQAMSGRGRSLEAFTARLMQALPALLRQADQRLGYLAEKTTLLDPERLLQRGYSLTLDAQGRLLRSADGLTTGDRLTTRLRDGCVESIVAGQGSKGTGKTGNRKGKPGGGKEEKGGQQTLFR